MLKLLNRVLDRNKPMFLFNSKHNAIDSFGDTGTPSFSMIALIEKNWLYLIYILAAYEIQIKTMWKHFS